MIHTRRQITLNQKQFREEIVEWLKSDFKELRKQIKAIEKTDNEEINQKKEELFERAKTTKIKDVVVEIKKLMISEKNIYPKFYAWWDEESQEVIKFLYDQSKQ